MSAGLFMYISSSLCKNYIKCYCRERRPRCSARKGGAIMFAMIKDNIRSFLDATIVITMIAIGLFSILADYRHFKKVKYLKDAAISLRIGLLCIILPFALILIARL